MNYKMIFYVLGKMLKLLSGLLILPTICSLIYKESRQITSAFFITIIISFTLYCIINFFTDSDDDRDFYKREGYVIVTLTWIIFSLLGALPFYISGEIPSYIDS